MTIFIVDDEPKIRNGMGKLLSAHPRWQVQTFADAKSALHRLYEGEADVIITDIQMPDVSGLDMIESVRQVNKTVPILILSGYSRFDYAQRAIESGVRKYLTKPTDPVDLIAALEQIERELYTMHDFPLSRFRETLEQVMLEDKGQWAKYYHGDMPQKRYARAFSFSDRARYYLTNPKVQQAIRTLLGNLDAVGIPVALLSQYLPTQYARVRSGKLPPQASDILIDRVGDCIDDYLYAVLDR